MLFDYCNEYKCVPPRRTVYKGYNLGACYGSLIDKINNNTDKMYIELSENEHTKIALDSYLDKKNSRFGFNNWRDLLFQYCNEYKCVPTCRTVYKGHNLGTCYYNIISKINNNTDKIYIELSENEYIKLPLDKYLDKKKRKNIIIRLNFNERRDLIFQYCNEYKSVPIGKTTIYKGHHIYQMYINMVRKINDNTGKIYIELSKNEYIIKNLDLYLDKKSKNVRLILMIYENYLSIAMNINKCQS